MEIDFGGISKKFAVDRAAAILRGVGIEHALIQFGGDIRTIGSHPSGEPWQAGILHPSKEGGSMTYVPLDNAGLATSGDRRRFLVKGGNPHSDMMNPKTGRPVQGPQLVSVIAPLCMLAGSCAMIAMLKGSDARKYLDDQELSYLLVDYNGTACGTLAVCVR